MPPNGGAPWRFVHPGGFDRESAEAALVAGQADLIAFGRPFIANPDLVERMRRKGELSAPDASTFCMPGAKGYTDDPTLAWWHGAACAGKMQANKEPPRASLWP